MADRERGGRGRDREPERSSRGGRDREDSGRSSRGGSSGRSGGGGTTYRYQPRNPETAAKRSTQGGGDYDKYLDDSVKMFKPNDGDNIIRILPPTWEGADHFGHDVYVHFGIGPDSQSYLCLDKMKGEACPICDERKNAIADGDEKYADEIKPIKRVLVALIDRDNEKDGPQVWAMPWGIDRDLCKLVIDKKSGEVLPIDDPDNGYDIEFSKSGTGIKTKYVGLSIARRESDLGNDKWLTYMVDNPLPEMLKYYDYDHINKVFGGAGAKSNTSSRDTSNKDDGDDLDREQERDLRRAESGRGSRGSREESLSWDDIHAMTFEELSALVDDKGLKDIDPEDSKDDEELADWICEDLKIEKEKPARRESRDSGDSPRSKLEEMRNKRNRVD